MALKDLVAKRVMDDILGGTQKTAKGEWKALVLDHLATRILSSCCRMHEIMGKGITIVEALDKEREPLPHLDAIYIMLPTEQNVERLSSDFGRARDPKNLYRAVHLFFLERCPQSIFSKITQNDHLAKRIATLQEAHMAFLPYESRVFSLDFPDAFHSYFSEGPIKKDDLFESISNQLATVCAMMGEYPAIRYWVDAQGRCAELARCVQTKLDSIKAVKSDLGTGPKATSELIIIDRGFDVATPVLHATSYQCMVYDLLDVENDVFTFQTASGDGTIQSKKTILDENDEIWADLRHMHIAEVSKAVTEKFQEFSKKKKLKNTSEDISVKDLARHIRRVPQYQKEMSQYSMHLDMVKKCMDRFHRGGINRLCEVEQNLALGTDKEGEVIQDLLRVVTATLLDRSVSVQEKLRVLILYLYRKGGMNKEDFSKMVQHSEIPKPERDTILNLMSLGMPVLTGEKVRKGKELTRKERMEQTYTDARWAPILRDILEYAAEGKLDQGYCPYLKGKPSASSAALSSGWASTGASSVRSRYNWIAKAEGKEAKGAPAKKDSPTIFIFIVGGVSYSEMRWIYEASQQFKSHEFVIGSTHITTPKDFLSRLNKLPTTISL